MKSTPKNIFTAIVFLGCVFQFIGCQTSAPKKSAGVDLFNGKNFKGWTILEHLNPGQEPVWSITNGLIHCAGKPNGYVRTDNGFQNYKLTVEWRFVKVAPHADNTGVLVHMQAPDRIWPRCIECQGMHGHQGDFWLWGGVDCAEPKNMRRNGIKMLQPSNENPVGEWNTYQVVCDGNIVEIIVNGKSMNKISGCSVSSGFIGLQSEGAEMEIRKVFLEPLKQINL
jgi:hypothetical protein